MAHNAGPVSVPQPRRRQVRNYAFALSALRANTAVPVLFDFAVLQSALIGPRAVVFLEKESRTGYFCLVLGQGQSRSDKLNVRVPNVRGQPCMMRLNRGDGSPCFLSQ
jgi:hypothetical protein